MSEKLTDEQLLDLQYFWQAKGDLERYVSFEELKPKIEKEYPLVLKAWNDYKLSVATLDLVMENLIR